MGCGQGAIPLTAVSSRVIRIQILGRLPHCWRFYLTRLRSCDIARHRGGSGRLHWPGPAFGFGRPNGSFRLDCDARSQALNGGSHENQSPKVSTIGRPLCMRHRPVAALCFGDVSTTAEGPLHVDANRCSRPNAGIQLSRFTAAKQPCKHPTVGAQREPRSMASAPVQRRRSTRLR